MVKNPAKEGMLNLGDLSMWLETLMRGSCLCQRIFVAFGLAPKHFDTVKRSRAKHSISRGTPLCFKDIDFEEQ